MLLYRRTRNIWDGKILRNWLIGEAAAIIFPARARGPWNVIQARAKRIRSRRYVFPANDDFPPRKSFAGNLCRNSFGFSSSAWFDSFYGNYRIRCFHWLAGAANDYLFTHWNTMFCFYAFVATGHKYIDNINGHRSIFIRTSDGIQFSSRILKIHWISENYQRFRLERKDSRITVPSKNVGNTLIMIQMLRHSKVTKNLAVDNFAHNPFQKKAKKVRGKKSSKFFLLVWNAQNCCTCM